MRLMLEQSVRSIQQREAALAKARTVRDAQGLLKASLRAREVSFADALEDPVARDMVWWRLVRMLHGWSHERVMGLAIELAQQGVSVDPKRRVRMLTVRQRLALIEATTKPKRAVKPSRGKTVRLARRGEIQPEKVTVLPVLTVAEDDCPLRCQRCKTRLRERVSNGLCGFCEVELEEAA